MTPPTPPTTAAEAVPLAIWPCGQTSARTQRAGRYLPATSVHPAKMLPELNASREWLRGLVEKGHGQVS